MKGAATEVVQFIFAAAKPDDLGRSFVREEAEKVRNSLSLFWGQSQSLEGSLTVHSRATLLVFRSRWNF